MSSFGIKIKKVPNKVQLHNAFPKFVQ